MSVLLQILSLLNDEQKQQFIGLLDMSHADLKSGEVHIEDEAENLQDMIANMFGIDLSSGQASRLATVVQNGSYISGLGMHNFFSTCA